jgi:uncharacterized Tic20 family protein
MENQPVSPRICRIAAICPLLGMTWIPFSTVILLLRDQQNWVIYVILALPIISILLSTALVKVMWVFCRRIDPFIDQSGRNVYNFMLSCSFYWFVFYLLAGTTCGLSLATNSVPALILMGAFLLIFLPMMLLIEFGCVFAGTACALQGEIYIYPFTINFAKDSSAVFNDNN